MKNEVVRNVEYYRNLSYGITLRKDDEDDWVARVEELPGCTAHGATQAEALENLEEVKEAWFDDALAAGSAIPEPHVPEALPSGKWLQRVPRSLHKNLSEMAEKEGVSLNQLVTSVLAEAVGRRHVNPIVTLQGSFDGTSMKIFGAGGHHNWHQKVYEFVDWEVQQRQPAIAMNIIDALQSPISALPNQIDETHFRMIERANKKELAFKA